MEGAAIAILLILFITVTALVSLIIYHIVKVGNLNDKVKKVCPIVPIVKEECPTMIGIGYKAESKDAEVLFERTQILINLLQKYACIKMKKSIAVYKDKFFSMLQDDPNVRNMSCKDVLAIMGIAFRKVQEETNIFGDNDVDEVAEAVNEIIKHIILVSCTKDRIDPTRATKLAADVFDSICS